MRLGTLSGFGLIALAFIDPGLALEPEETKIIRAIRIVGSQVIVPFIQMIWFDLGSGQCGQGLVSHFGIREKAFYHRGRVR